MSDFKQGDMVMLVNETGRHARQIDHVTSTGIIALVGERTRFRQDGTATNNLGQQRIESLTRESLVFREAIELLTNPQTAKRYVELWNESDMPFEIDLSDPDAPWNQQGASNE